MTEAALKVRLDQALKAMTRAVTLIGVGEVERAYDVLRWTLCVLMPREEGEAVGIEVVVPSGGENPEEV